MKSLKDVPENQPDPNRRVHQLFGDLSTHLNNLVYRETGADDPGFLDRSMRGSEVWTDDLRSALGSCQVFVALLSPAYLQSSWCALEWNAFASRRVRRRGASDERRTTSIIPVVWTSPRRYTVPAAIHSVQLFSPARLPYPNVRQQYEDEGLYTLLALEAQGIDGIVLRLAQRIVELAWENEIGPLEVDVNDLPSKFQEDEP